MQKKILVILAHPAKESYCGALAQAYVEGARAAGAEVQEIFVSGLQLDAPAAPEYKGPPRPGQDVATVQDAVRWAEHLVFVYPIMWGTIPAILKAFFEKAFTPGFAVNFHKDSPLWDKLLRGRSARLIVTMNTPPWLYRWVFKRPGHLTMKKPILEFCGIKPVRITDVGPVQSATEVRRQKWLANTRLLGQRCA